MSVWTELQAQWNATGSSTWGDYTGWDQYKAVFFWDRQMGPFPYYYRPDDSVTSNYIWARFLIWGVFPHTEPGPTSGGRPVWDALQDYYVWRDTGVSSIPGYGPTTSGGNGIILTELTGPPAPSAFGMQVFAESGLLTYSTDDVTWNQVDFFFVAGNGTASHTYAVLSGREALVVQLLVNAPPADRRAIAHTITVTSTTVSVSGGTEDAFILVLMR